MPAERRTHSGATCLLSTSGESKAAGVCGDRNTPRPRAFDPAVSLDAPPPVVTLSALGVVDRSMASPAPLEGARSAGGFNGHQSIRSACATTPPALPPAFRAAPRPRGGDQ